MIEKIRAFLKGTGKDNGMDSSQGGVAFSHLELEQQLNYTFKDQELLSHALTHKSSISPEKDPKGLSSNERLEFLGDALLDFLVTEELFVRYPDYSEGQLAKIKSLLVSRKILGILAGRIKLEQYVIKSRGEKKSSGQDSQKITAIGANAYEALLAALYLDGGIKPVRDFLSLNFYPSIDTFLNDVENRNYKSRLLELSQAEGLGMPFYPLLSEDGPDHMKQFSIAVEVAGKRLGTGVGKTKKDAEQDAARVAIKKMDTKCVQSLKQTR